MPSSSCTSRPLVVTGLVVFLSIAAAVQLARAATPVRPSAPKAALTVTVTRPEIAALPVRIAANGDIAAWQEARVGTQADGLRLQEVFVNVGETVRRGQVLATFEAAPVEIELTQSRAAIAEAEAALHEATADAERARGLQASGVLSAQQIQQYLTGERAAKARHDAALARSRAQELRLQHTRVRAPDDGVVSARTAAVGAVLPSGEELFRLIRRNRLEWRAEVPAPQLARLQAGHTATITPAGGEPIRGTVRMVGPAVDTRSRHGLVYVDLPPGTQARAGMFARGEFEIGPGAKQLTLPQTCVLQREGFDYVFVVGRDARVSQTKVVLGRRAGPRVEVLAGLDGESQVVASGGAFLGDGDLVQVVTDALDASNARQGTTSASDLK